MSTQDKFKDQLAAVNGQLDKLDKMLEQYDYVVVVSDKLQVRRSYLVLGVVTFFALFISWGIGGKFLSNLIGFVYPLYVSFKVLKSKDININKHQTQWLTYWVVYAAFTLVESFTDLFLLWIPAYHLAKIAFLMWCYMPQTEGATLIYEKVIFPFMSKNEGRFDAAMARMERTGENFANDLSAEANNAKQRLAKEALNTIMTNQTEYKSH